MGWTFYNSSGQRLSSAATNISVLDIDGATEMGAAIVDADLLIIDDGAGGTNKSVLASRIATYIGPGSGTIGQVVQDSLLTVFTSTSSSFTDITGLAVAITPTASSSKILVHFSLVGSQNVGVERAAFRLMRDSTAISVGTAAGSRTPLTGEFAQFNASVLSGPLGGVFLDSPSSTSELTYKLQVRTPSEVYINRTDDYEDAATAGNYASNIVVMEVLA